MPENLQGTSPLTHFRALPESILAGRQEKGAVAPFLLDRIIRELLSTDFRGISSQSHSRLLWYSTVLLTTVPLRCSSPVFLYIQNGLLSKEDQKLPLAWHVIRSLEHVYLVEYFISRMFMWSQEVIVSHPESQVIVGTVDVIKFVRAAVRSLVRAVQPFNHLFESKRLNLG